MSPLRLLVCVLAIAVPALTQTTGRNLAVVAPPIIGYSAVFDLTHPTNTAGNPYVILWCMPQYPGIYPLTVPGLTLNGALRVDPTTSFAAFSGVFGASGRVQHSIAIPHDPLLVGFSWDLQSVDLAVVPPSVSFSDNDLALSIASVPPSSMVPIAPGSFLMGSNATTNSPYFGHPVERPVHQVTISRAFWIGAHEVTQAEYLAVMATNPSRYQGPSYPNAPQRPVESMSWFAAVAYCQALNAIEQTAGRVPPGYQYRLPTEAEWEYCCRAGTTTEYAFGPSLDCSQASFGYNYHTNAYCGYSATSVVGSFAPNAFGLYDMHGNVREWCLDSGNAIVNTSTYPSSPVVDPVVRSGPDKVLRGGSYSTYSFECRSAHRAWMWPFNADYTVGFRVVLAPILP